MRIKHRLKKFCRYCGLIWCKSGHHKWDNSAGKQDRDYGADALSSWNCYVRPSALIRKCVRPGCGRVENFNVWANQWLDFGDFTVNYYEKCLREDSEKSALHREIV